MPWALLVRLLSQCLRLPCSSLAGWGGSVEVIHMFLVHVFMPESKTRHCSLSSLLCGSGGSKGVSFPLLSFHPTKRCSGESVDPASWLPIAAPTAGPGSTRQSLNCDGAASLNCGSHPSLIRVPKSGFVLWTALPFLPASW